jgi:hypothetical protein
MVRAPAVKWLSPLVGDRSGLVAALELIYCGGQRQEDAAFADFVQNPRCVQ